MVKRFEGIVGKVCVCPECHWIYPNDTPFECENDKCKIYGKKGIMCNVIAPLTKEVKKK